MGIDIFRLAIGKVFVVRWLMFFGQLVRFNWKVPTSRVWKVLGVTESNFVGSWPEFRRCFWRQQFFCEVSLNILFGCSKSCGKF